jgi:uncharacterized protein YigE (DUF2233 family)
MLRRHLLLTFAATLAKASQARAAGDAIIAQRQPDLDLSHGATLHRFTTGDDVEFTVVKFDAARCALRVIDQPDKAKAVSLAKAMPPINAVAGVNGGFFSTQFEPLGLSISQGKRCGTWQRSSLLGGLLMVRKGKPALLWRDEFKDSQDITELLQTGPRLVNQAQPIKGLETKSRRPRTFIATDNNGRWLLGIAVYTSLTELSQLLVTPGLIPGMKIFRALNLDGGKSTGLWARAKDGHIVSEPEFSTVRNFVAIVPRS